jgi:hypothetical protein
MLEDSEIRCYILKYSFMDIIPTLILKFNEMVEAQPVESN